ncbi:MAG: histidinol dehydrogenase [Pseudomonadales bacterium]
MLISKLDSATSDFLPDLDRLLAFDSEDDAAVSQRVAAIIASVRESGDTALLDFTNKLDGWNPAHVEDLCLRSHDLHSAKQHISAAQLHSLERAAERIRSYHEHQKQPSWQIEEDDGTVLGQQITALDRVGVYVPGGKASYPSSVLMNVIPARVAGVQQVCMVVPAPGGEISPLVLAAASIAGVDEVWKIGGAQAVAAMAFGTASINRVDKIVGPGNVYVAEAKRQVFGRVGLDMVAGPSEILIIADEHANPDWLALDMFAQAEHDEMAQSILLSPSQSLLAEVEASIERLLPDMDRESIIRESLQRRGALIAVSDLAEAVELSNRIAPEHLELAVQEPEAWLPSIRHAGAIFMGVHSPEAFGDYCAGPNHVLPTSGTARFASPLGVYDFQKRSSLINCSPAKADELALIAGELARGEGLQAHALSALARRSKAD